jgi:hypothetical protein
VSNGSFPIRRGFNEVYRLFRQPGSERGVSYSNLSVIGEDFHD